ncbi:hypothetical protein IGJ55_003008 [Enterococcus sp. AZ170]|uniref:winged helix-turn-helix domain-containing protein n=1 Tax=unclassified Enterococcus TaxID=2608891 RepID=UPI003D2DFCEC
MSDLGVIDQPLLDNERWFKQLAEEQHSLAVIHEKEELASFSGVVIPLTEKEKLPVVVDWLRICQTNPHLFVWIFSTIALDYEQELLMELGANAVVTDETQIHRLSLIIKNTFQRTKETASGHQEEGDRTIVNEQNQSISVNGREQLLTRNEYQLLRLLYQNKDTCVSYDRLITTIWVNNEKANLCTLANVVFHLRNKVKGSEDFTIKTIRNKGYMYSVNK